MVEDNNERLARIETEIGALKTGQADIRSTLSQLMTLLVRVSADIGEIKGRIADAPTARDFGRLEGRLDALEARQPVTLAYQTPSERRSGGD